VPAAAAPFDAASAPVGTVVDFGRFIKGEKNFWKCETTVNACNNNFIKDECAERDHTVTYPPAPAVPMTGPVLSRAEQRAFVLALLDVPVEYWWMQVVSEMPAPVRVLVSMALVDRSQLRRRFDNSELLLAAADLLRPRWTREDAESAALNLPMLLALGSQAEQKRAYERVVRMITGDEP
jgi:hypothetical protein